MISEDKRLQYIKETALAMFGEKKVAELIGLSPAELQSLRSDPKLQEEVQAQARALAETGEGFRIQAKRFAESILQDVAAIAADNNEDAKDRVKASELLLKVSGYMPKDAPQQQVSISINAALTDATARRAMALSDRDYIDITPAPVAPLPHADPLPPANAPVPVTRRPKPISPSQARKNLAYTSAPPAPPAPPAPIYNEFSGGLE